MRLDDANQATRSPVIALANQRITRTGSARRRRRGGVMIEFTLCVTFLMTLFLGVWAYGYGFYVYSELENAVRNGARYASKLPYDSSSSTPSASFLTKVQQMTVYGDPNVSNGTPLAPNLTTSNVALTVTMANAAPATVTVAITGYTLPGYWNVTLNNKPYVWFPYLGYWSPP
jgi:Flp pilus assembly protein TadG